MMSALLRDSSFKTTPGQGDTAKKIKKETCRLNMRIYSFTNRIVDVWNILANDVVNAKMVEQFEIGLDKLWEHQDN